MVKSMTGYGRGEFEKDGRVYTVEIKTINHRYSDVTVKLPRYLNFLEDKVRKYISKNLSRGKIEVYISLKNMSDKGRNIKIDKVLAETYIDELRDLAKEYNLQDDITVMSLAKLGDIIVVENESAEDLYSDELQCALEIAMKNINEARSLEGKRLAEDIEKRLDKISEYVEQVEKMSDKLLEDYKVKLKNRINELEANDIVDENRIGIEIVLFADKSSICEEVIRLKSHIESFRNMLNAEGPIGKKIDFLIQEMNRETNTIGSKANSIGITNYVIEMKNEIENIREQIQNIE